MASVGISVVLAGGDATFGREGAKLERQARLEMSEGLTEGSPERGLGGRGEVPVLERRMHARVGARFTASRSGKAGFFLEDDVENVSRSGLCLLTEERVRPGDRMELLLRHEGQSDEFAVQGEVVRSREGRDGRFIVGLYFNFVEPMQKNALGRFLDVFLRDVPQPASPRIRVRLDGPDAEQQAVHLAQLEDRGLFIEVPQPLSIFSKTCVRLVNPLTQEVYDLSGEVTQAQVMTGREGPEGQSQPLYGVGVRFSDLAPHEREAIDRLKTTLGGSRRSRVPGGRPPEC